MWGRVIVKELEFLSFFTGGNLAVQNKLEFNKSRKMVQIDNKCGLMDGSDVTR